MHIDILVEEPSAKTSLEILVPKILGDRASFSVIGFQGKRQMQNRLSSRLRGYAARIRHENLRVVVLIDEDRQDCRGLKARLEDMALNVGLRTKSSPGALGAFHVVNRLAIEELEAWFFGDIEALHAAFPRIPLSLAQKAPYRVPDAILGGTWERLHKLLRERNYCGDRFPKLRVAREVSAHMAPERNRSRSFQQFRDALEAVIA